MSAGQIKKTTTSSEFQKNWAKLQSAYLDSVAEKIDELQDLWESATRKDMETLHRKTHSLAGSGATYGLKELSSIARELEQFLQHMQENSFPGNTNPNIRFKEFLSKLRQVQHRIESPPPLTKKIPSSKPHPGNLIHGDPLNILVAEDDTASRLQLKLILESLGHSVIAVDNGREAVARFQEQRPDMVIMDIFMPEMDGFEAAKLIKEHSAPSFIPIIFLTAASDEESLVKSITAGGDDFLVKPYNHIVLQAKIHALQRIELLNRELEAYKKKTEEEVYLARHLYDTIVSRNTQSVPGLLRWSESAGHFSGDMVLYRDSPNGLLNIFVADFTGHGMAAALGGMAAADVFHALSEKGGSPAQILSELNRKLNHILPTGRYCAATLVSIDAEAKKARLWNCGLPHALLKKNETVETFSSNNLPLGVLPEQDASFNYYDFDINPGHSLVIYSDGVTESQDAEGNMYGDDRLQQLVAHTKGAGEGVMAAIRKDVIQHVTESGEFNDDVTLLVIGFTEH